MLASPKNQTLHREGLLDISLALQQHTMLFLDSKQITVRPIDSIICPYLQFFQKWVYLRKKNQYMVHFWTSSGLFTSGLFTSGLSTSGQFTSNPLWSISDLLLMHFWSTFDPLLIHFRSTSDPLSVNFWSSCQNSLSMTPYTKI